MLKFKYLFFLCILLSRFLCGMDVKQEVQALISARSPYAMRVDMNDVQMVVVRPQDSKRTLWTCALAGCTAVAVVATTPTGERIAILTHTFPDRILNRFKRELAYIKDKGCAHGTVLILTPETRATQTPLCQENVDELIAMIMPIFSYRTFNIQYYDAFSDSSPDVYYHALILQIPGSESAQPPHYRSWLSEGNL